MLLQTLILTWILGNVSKRVLENYNRMAPRVLRVLFFHLWQLNQGLNVASGVEKGDTVLPTAAKGMVAKLLTGEAAGLRSLGSNC